MDANNSQIRTAVKDNEHQNSVEHQDLHLSAMEHTLPQDELLLNIETPNGALRLIRSQRSGMRAIQQND